MAKKINFLTVDETKRASAALRDFHIEHVVVQYPKWVYEHGDARTPKQDEITAQLCFSQQFLPVVIPKTLQQTVFLRKKK